MTKEQSSLYLKYHNSCDPETKFRIARAIVASQKDYPLDAHWQNESLSTLDGEIWRPLAVRGFEKCYEFSSFGRLKRLFRYVEGHYRGVPKRWEEKVLIGNDKGNGRLRFVLRLNGDQAKIEAHRCAALTYWPNPERHPLVNHIDGNPLNNHYLNVEWSTYSFNCMHGFRVLGRVSPHLGATGSDSRFCKGEVGRYDKSGKLEKVYPSSVDAEADGFNSGHISSVISGKRKSHGGFIWKRIGV